MIEQKAVKAKALEEKVASLIREIEQRDACFSRVELLSGEDDGRNKTHSVDEVFGLPLPRASELAKRYMNEDHVMPYGGGSTAVTVMSVYALRDGIVLQFHKVITNSYGSPVKDYTWFTHLSFEIETRLREGKLTPEQVEEVLEAVERDAKEIEEMAAGMTTRSYKVEVPYSGHVIAVCAKCGEVIKPKCEEHARFYDALVFVHEHQPSFVVLRREGVQSFGEVPEQLLEIVRELWLRDGRRAVVKIEKLVQAWLQQKKEEEYEAAARAFFLSLA